MRTILIAVDGSIRARGVFGAGVELARATSAGVVLYRAIDVPPDFAPAAATNRVDPLPAYLEAEARAQLESMIATSGDVLCEARVDQAAQPWRAILTAADAVDAELIVIGSHGYHGWDRILGTTAGKVANLARRNVLVVHERPAAVEGQ